MQQVSVIEFVKMAGNYRTGDQAGFPTERADEFVSKGFAKMIRRDVPEVEPAVVASDTLRVVNELRARLVGAERDAKSVARDPAASALAAEALDGVEAAKRQLAALERQLASAGQLTVGDSRKPNPAGKAN